MIDAKAPDRHKWFRFSLRSMIAATVILILGVSHWNTSQELNSTRNALAQLQRDTGQLVVSNPERLHAVLGKNLPTDTWRWHVYVPLGESYLIGRAIVGVDPDPVGSAERAVLTSGVWEVGCFISSVEYCNIGLYLRREGGNEVDSFSNSVGLPISNVPWLSDEFFREIEVLGETRTESVGRGEQAVLYRYFAMPNGQRQSNMPHDAPKIEIRLVPIPHKK